MPRLLLERREDANGELWLATPLDELDQRVQVVVGVLGDSGREGGRETRFHQLLAAASGRPDRAPARLSFSSACLVSDLEADCSYLVDSRTRPVA